MTEPMRIQVQISGGNAVLSIADYEMIQAYLRQQANTLQTSDKIISAQTELIQIQKRELEVLEMQLAAIRMHVKTLQHELNCYRVTYGEQVQGLRKS